MTVYYDYTVGTKRQDGITIVHGPIIDTLVNSNFDVVILFYRISQPDSIYAQQMREAFSIDIPDSNFYIKSAFAPNFTTLNIKIGSKYTRLIIVYITDSSMISYQSVSNNMSLITQGLTKNLNVALINDCQEYGDWEELAPTIIHFAKLTILSNAFGVPSPKAQPLTKSANETAEQ